MKIGDYVWWWGDGVKSGGEICGDYRICGKPIFKIRSFDKWKYTHIYRLEKSLELLTTEEVFALEMEK